MNKAIHTSAGDEAASRAEQRSLHFWAIGDLHYRARPQWQAIHSRRLAPLFQDVRPLWQDEGVPAFVVSPGDIVHTGAPQNYQLAQSELLAALGNIPFYPGIGNHEYHRERAGDTLHTAEEFRLAWGTPARSTWSAGGVTCIMLDHPNPYLRSASAEDPQVWLSPETLTFLDTSLRAAPHQPAIIFAHSPLRQTVLDRDPARNLDNDSQEGRFSLANSAAVRNILARHSHAALYICGHTHSGWGSPNLVYTELLGGHPLTHVNLMSPWYTGRHHGPRRIDGPQKFVYIPDEPDILPSFAFSISPREALIRIRDSHTHRWLAQWSVPMPCAIVTKS